MSYSVDLRNRVVEFVESGGTKERAIEVFKVSRWCVYDWVNREDLSPKKYPEDRKRKLDWEALYQRVLKHPEDRLIDHAKHFGVHKNTIQHALSRMQITRKKNAALYRKG